MKRILINSIFCFCYYIGVFRLFYFLTRNRQRIITFHHVIPDRYFDNSLCLGVSCTESVFDYQLKLIAEKFHFTTKVQKKTSCMITFDDGYNNNYSIALPILEKYMVKAIFFITYNLIINNKPLWIDLVLKWCSYVPNGSYKLDNIEIEASDTNRMSLYNYIINQIKKEYSSKKQIIQLLNNIYSFDKLELNPVLDDLRFKALSISQLDQIKAGGHLVASHTIDHDILSLLEKEQLEQEIDKSRNLSLTFYNCNYFAYPFGGVNEVSETVLKSYLESKFKKCFVNYWHFKNNNRDESMQRISLPNTTNKYIIHAYLSGFYFFLKRE